MKVVVLAGPTGTGKSELAVRIALAADGEIVNYDSIQLYRGFDIGSAKPSMDVRSRVPHHLFDVIDADQEINAAGYARLARSVCQDIHDRGMLPILAGGTFFYLRALLSGLPQMPGRDEQVRKRIQRIAARPRGQQRLHRWLTRVDPVSGARIPPPDRHRVERALEVWIATGRPISSWDRPTASSDEDVPALKLAVSVPRAELVKRLDARTQELYRIGLVEETRSLLSRYDRSARPFTAIGYKEAVSVVAGEIDEATAITETSRRTRAYAKRQMTWLRSERNVQWLEDAEQEQRLSAALRLIERFRLE